MQDDGIVTRPEASRHPGHGRIDRQDDVTVGEPLLALHAQVHRMPGMQIDGIWPGLDHRDGITLGKFL